MDARNSTEFSEQIWPCDFVSLADVRGLCMCLIGYAGVLSHDEIVKLCFSDMLNSVTRTWSLLFNPIKRIGTGMEIR